MGNVPGAYSIRGAGTSSGFTGKDAPPFWTTIFKVRERGRMSFLISRVQAGFVPLSFHERPIVRGGFFKMETPADQPVTSGSAIPSPTGSSTPFNTCMSES